MTAWMAAPPRLTKLGAKWVEVRKRRAEASEMAWWSVFENGQQHPLIVMLAWASRVCLRLVEVASLREEAAGVGQPF